MRACVPACVYGRADRTHRITQAAECTTKDPSQPTNPTPTPKPRTAQSTGFPRHHRVLHVKQEVRSSGKTVLETVLQSDVEREVLLEVRCFITV